MRSSTTVSGTARRMSCRLDSAGAGTGSPASTASRIVQQRTDAASGPAESREVDKGNTPASGTRRAVGLKPVSPHRAEGMRTDPPVSVPSAATAMPSVTETAAPEEEPPGMRPVARSQGLRGVPWCGFRPNPE